jgi:phosphoribulokinase
MSVQHPIISITGSSGAGTTSVKRIFELIFRRERVTAAFIEGDAFHRFDRLAMKKKIADGEKISLTFTFDDGSKVTTEAQVRKAGMMQ